MKKKVILSLLAYTGLINFIVVGCVILLMYFVNDQSILYFLSNVFGIYIQYSFIPAILSAIFSKKLANRKVSSFILSLNIIYLILYVLGFLYVFCIFH